MTLLCICPHNTLRVIAPVICRNICKLFCRSLYCQHSKSGKVQGVKTHLAAVVLSCQSVGTNAECAWEYMTAVIIGMLSNQINTSWRKIKLRLSSFSKNLCKFFSHFSLHNRNLLICLYPLHYQVFP